MIIRCYHEKQSDISLANDAYVFMVDGRIPHGGMFDRLKGLITVYAIAKSQNISFYIHFTYPFRLEKYLYPNSYDWRIRDEDMIYESTLKSPLFGPSQIM